MNKSRIVLLHQLLRWSFIILVNLGAKAVLAQGDFYTPKSLIIPLHDQKNQLHVSLGRGGGYDLNLSYAFLKHFAVFNTVTIDNEIKKRITIMGDRYNVDRNDYVVKGGLGYFSRTETAKLSIFEAYVGGGLSKIDNYWYFKDDDDGDLTQAKYWTVFGQINGGKKIKRSEYAMGLRIAYSEYTDISFYSNHPNSSYTRSSYNNLKGFSVDPVISYSYILNGFKLNAQAGLAVPGDLGSTSRIDSHTTTVIRSEENVPLWAILGRLSVQYNINFNKQK